MFVYVCFMFAFMIGFVDWLDTMTEGSCICEKSLEMRICLWPEFDCPEVTLCGWQDIKIQLLLLPTEASFAAIQQQWVPGHFTWWKLIFRFKSMIEEKWTAGQGHKGRTCPLQSVILYFLSRSNFIRQASKRRKKERERDKEKREEMKVNNVIYIYI